MLTPELKILKEFLENNHNVFNNEEEILNALQVLDKTDIGPLLESLSKSSAVCPTCGRKY